MDQAKRIPLCLKIQCVAWLWHMLPSTMMARASTVIKRLSRLHLTLLDWGWRPVICSHTRFLHTSGIRPRSLGVARLLVVRAHPSPSAGTLPSLPANQPAARPPNGCLSVCHCQTPLPSQSLSLFLMDCCLQD